MAVSVHHISKSYGNLKVVDDVSLNIADGQVTVIVGPSGAGKSTLLQIIGTLDKPDSGKILYDQIEVTTLSHQKLSLFRNQNIGFVFQFHHLLPEFTALENVGIPALIHAQSGKEINNRAKMLLEMLGLAQRMNHKPAQLSGGEQQRVAVARALMNEPKIILADEPSGNLDSANAESLHDLFFELKDKMGQSFVIVTHNNKLAERADLLIKMKDGKIVD